MDRHHIILVFLGILLTQCSNHMVRCVMTDVRLVGGPTPDRGTVEISQGNATWETTCGTYLGIFDVIVICRQLGFTGASRTITPTPYGQNSTPTRGLECNENATDLSECRLFSSARECPEAGGASCHVSMVTASTVSSPISLATSIELSSINQAVIKDNGSAAATSAPSTTCQATSALPLTGKNTGLYGGIGGGVAAFIIIVIIIVIILIMGRRSRKGRKDPTSSQRMSLASTSTPTGINGLGVTNAALAETSGAGGSQLGLHASNNAAAAVPTASGGDKSGLLVNLNPTKSMNIYGGIDDEVLGDEMMPYASFDNAATVQNNNGRLSVVYAMPDRNGNEPRNDYEGITNEMAPYASVDNVSPMRPRTMPNKNDRLSVVYAAPDKNGNEPRNDYEGITNEMAPYASVDNVSPMRPRTMPNMNDRLSVVYAAPDKNGKGHRNDTSEDFDCLYAMPDMPRGQPDGNDDGIVHGPYAKADESSSGYQYEPDMVENELYTI